MWTSEIGDMSMLYGHGLKTFTNDPNCLETHILLLEHSLMTLIVLKHT